MAGFSDRLGAISGVEGAVRCFLLVFVGFLLVVLEHWVAVLCVELMMVHLLHF